MNARDELEFQLSQWFEATAPARPPEGLLDAVLARTAQTRRRPAWRVVDHWLSPAASIRLATVRRTALVLAVLALIVAMVVVGLMIAGSMERRPPPFGPARPGLIAFASDGQIFVAQPDGSDKRALTPAGQDAQHPIWSPDGRKVSYWSLVLLDEGSTPEGQLDYLGLYQATLTVIDADGGRPVVIDSRPIPTSDSDLNLPPLVAWAPDSERLAYSAPIESVSRVFVARADTPGSVAIGDPALPAAHPAWSPDGTTIAFSGGRYDDDRGVYLMSADGSGIRRVSTAPGTGDFSPAWSPDGKTIAFTGGARCAEELWVVQADGSGERPILNDPEYSPSGQSWSPDGTMIAFSRHLAGDYCTAQAYTGAVVVAQADGSGMRVLKDSGVYGTGFQWPMVWSPDGKSILAFLASSASSGGEAIVQLPVDGSAPFVIDASGLGGREADWQRLAP
jgi:Tol biopolymer transport system component